MKLDQVLIVVPTHGEMEVIRRDFQGPGCKWVLCGVGPAKAALETTTAILRNSPGLVVLAGICGIFSRSRRRLGSLFMAQSETYGDLGRCTVNGIEPIVISGKRLESHFDLMPHISAFSLRPFLKHLDVTIGHMVTVSCTSNSEERPLLGSGTREYICENMEGAAVAQVCTSFGVPFLEIRAGSNFVGDQDLANWQIGPALKKLAQVLGPLLEHVRMV